MVLQVFVYAYLHMGLNLFVMTIRMRTEQTGEDTIRTHADHTLVSQPDANYVLLCGYIRMYRNSSLSDLLLVSEQVCHRLVTSKSSLHL